MSLGGDHMSRSGLYIKNLSGHLSYQSFRPSTLPPKPPIKIDDRLNHKLKVCYRLLGELNGVSRLIPNKALFISMYVRKEALLSSQIEGTQATLDDIFDPHIDKNINQDTEEVIQYLKALRHANERFNQLPISTRFLKEIHAVLLSSSRGKEKEPGQLRQTQNWIGATGEPLNKARFIPPNIEDMHQALSELEKYIHENNDEDLIIKIGLVHYQFETIHPFLDGNGRLGRLLITLLLKQYNLLNEDTLYLSYYLKKNRIEYYDRLMEVRLKGHYEQWLLFFVEGVIESAKHALKTIDDLLSLRTKNMQLLSSLKGSQKTTALALFDYIEAHPIIDITETSQNINKAFNTTSKAVDKFIELGILKQVQGHKRYRTFAYEPYLKILRDGTE